MGSLLKRAQTSQPWIHQLLLESQIPLSRVSTVLCNFAVIPIWDEFCWNRTAIWIFSSLGTGTNKRVNFVLICIPPWRGHGAEQPPRVASFKGLWQLRWTPLLSPSTVLWSKRDLKWSLWHELACGDPPWLYPTLRSRARGWKEDFYQRWGPGPCIRSVTAVSLSSGLLRPGFSPDIPSPGLTWDNTTQKRGKSLWWCFSWGY